MSGNVTGRVWHGGYHVFREAAARIEAAVGPGDLPILTRGALGLEPPERYVFYQTEPLHVGIKREPRYMAMLDGAEAVYDYSEMNEEFYPRGEFRPLPLGSVPQSRPAGERDIDVLFYGLLTPRRRELLEPLGTTIIEGVYGGRRNEMERRAHVVICPNAYDDRNGNPLRVFPALERGARVLVEQTREGWFNEAVRPHAPVVPYERMAETCRAMLAGQEAAA